MTTETKELLVIFMPIFQIIMTASEVMDLSDIMEVVAVFRCKFCSKTCSTPTEMSLHVTLVHAVSTPFCTLKYQK